MTTDPITNPNPNPSSNPNPNPSSNPNPDPSSNPNPSPSPRPLALALVRSDLKHDLVIIARTDCRNAEAGGGLDEAIARCVAFEQAGYP